MNQPQQHLFICAGNTCRSQMAAALAGYYFPQHRFVSAGLQARTGLPTSDNALVLLEQRGILWSGTSTPLDPKVLVASDSVWVMTQAQRLTLLDMMVAWELMQPHRDKIQCLADNDIDDPYGLDLSVYDACLQTIHRALMARFGGVL